MMPFRNLDETEARKQERIAFLEQHFHLSEEKIKTLTESNFRLDMENCRLVYESRDLRERYRADQIATIIVLWIVSIGILRVLLDKEFWPDAFLCLSSLLAATGYYLIRIRRELKV